MSNLGIGIGVLVACAVTYLVIKYVAKRKPAPKKQVSGNLQALMVSLAAYCGTYRPEALPQDRIVRVGQALLNVMREVPGGETDLLRALINNAIRTGEYPPILEGHTQAFARVAAAIREVSDWIGENGFPEPSRTVSA